MAKRSSNPGRGGWGRLTLEVHLPAVYYQSLPASITKNYDDWQHGSGSFLYNNQEYLWGGMVDLEGLFTYGNNGKDHTLYDFFSIVIPHLFSNILYDPEDNGRHVLVYTDEWAQVGKTTQWTFTTGAYRTIRKGKK